MKFGITQKFSCSYLQAQQEQLLVLVEDPLTVSKEYEHLIAYGFRRSGNQVYRPNCPLCNACQSIRIPVQQFEPSKNQRRVLNKNRDITVVVSHSDKLEYYSLYEDYINTRHRDGTMYPASESQYLSFISSEWNQSVFLEFHIDQQLIGVAVTDKLDHAASALYTFFDPAFAHRSIGTLAILKQLEFAVDHGLQYLYLGYQVDACKKMNYKTNFYPYERFVDGKWYYFTKNT